MSEAKPCGDTGDDARSAAGTDVLLVVDTVTLLDRASVSDGKPQSAPDDAYYALAPNAEALSGTHGAKWVIDAQPGTRLKLRWTPLAMRGEHAALLQFVLADEATLGRASLHVESHASRYAPQSGKPEEPVAREAPDAYWAAEVIARGTADVNVEATVTDRDANVLGRFILSLQIVVP
ncbi:inclusion body protein [Pandoraea aquatica]|uniref:Inclusion body protein n=1 Tax=Pandoraea aquatica TaxID=2508290 RepID=A0A5E4RZR5_9BURK|nr:AidA/PixA family protein [Pandoraea aquatica]VVD67339.1 inclusion body protein [Pandoraea aquatica]